VLLAVGAAGMLGGGDADSRALAVTGAVTQMVSHGIVTGALFLLVGVLWDRRGTYDLNAYGGLAGVAPRFAGLTVVASFASLGLPGLSGFVAEFQIFSGSLGPAPVGTVVALLGIVLTAGLFLTLLQRLLLGLPRGATGAFADLRGEEAAAVVPLLVLSVVIGVFPRFLLDVIEPAARSVAALVAR